MTSTHRPVGVIGAGPAGLCCAMFLVKLGVPVEIYESLASPSNLWRAPGIHAKTLEVLARHDLSDAFLKAGYPIDKMATLYRGQFITGSSMQSIRTEFPMVLACAQTNTERILRDKLDELHVPIHWSHKFVSYEFVDSYVSAQFKQTDAMGQEQLVTREFAYLVGCDGGHSQVRKAIGARFAGETRDHIITICDIESDAKWLPAGCGILHIGGMMGSIRVGPNQHRMFLLSRDGKTTYTAEQFVEIVQTFLAPYKLEKVKVCDIAYFNVNERRASHYISRDKHVFLCGDAAHVHSPAGGQGMNMSIQDSENLAWKLAMIYHGQADAHILDTFAQERIPVADEVIKRTSQLSRNSMFFLLIPWIWPLTLKLSQYIPARLIRGTMEHGSQLSIDYSQYKGSLIIKECAAWKNAIYSSWLTSWMSWFTKELCAPGMRAIDGVVVNLLSADHPVCRLREWQSKHFGAHELLVFLNISPESHSLTLAEQAALPSSTADGTDEKPQTLKRSKDIISYQLTTDLLNQVKQLTTAMSASRVPIATAIILYQGNVSNAQLTTEATTLITQLHHALPQAQVFADQDQGERYDHLDLARLYQCQKGREHVAYLIRPDAYVAARAPLSEALDVFQSYLNQLV